MNLIQNEFFIGFLINFLLICVFFRLPIMTKSGWINAGFLGTMLWGCLSWQGWTSIVLYLFLGTLVTKIGYKYKTKKGIAEKRGGRRGPENVWGSAATGLFFAVLIKLNLWNLDLLKVAFASSFSAKLGDTFGSEIGKRFGKNTFLITSLRKVEKGTEGAISLEGTLASLLGSIIMSFAFLKLGIIYSYLQFIIVSISGFIATIIESFIGASLQEKYKLSNEIVNSIQTSIGAIFAIVFFLVLGKL